MSRGRSMRCQRSSRWRARVHRGDPTLECRHASERPWQGRRQGRRLGAGAAGRGGRRRARRSRKRQRLSARLRARWSAQLTTGYRRGQRGVSAARGRPRASSKLLKILGNVGGHERGRWRRDHAKLTPGPGRAGKGGIRSYRRRDLEDSTGRCRVLGALGGRTLGRSLDLSRLLRCGVGRQGRSVRLAHGVGLSRTLTHDDDFPIRAQIEGNGV
jgi:hypothetical protein